MLRLWWRSSDGYYYHYKTYHYNNFNHNETYHNETYHYDNKFDHHHQSTKSHALQGPTFV